MHLVGVGLAAALVLGGAGLPAAATPTDQVRPGAASRDWRGRTGLRARAAERLRSRSTTGVVDPAAPQPVQAAVQGDALTIPDPLDATAGPRGDIRALMVGSGPGGSLQFTMQVEEYADPLVDPNWRFGITGALWFVDTSGDGGQMSRLRCSTTGTGSRPRSRAGTVSSCAARQRPPTPPAGPTQQRSPLAASAT